MIGSSHSSGSSGIVEESDGDEGDDLIEDDEDLQPVAGPSKPRSKGYGLYKPPTLQEMDRLRASETTGSNTFALQLEALLSSTLLPTTPQASLKSLLLTIHSHILSLPVLPPLHPQEAAKRTPMTFPGPEEFSPLRKGADVKWTLGWEKPSEVFVGGSWAVCGGYKKGKGEMGGIDMVVVMPQVCLKARNGAENLDDVLAKGSDIVSILSQASPLSHHHLRFSSVLGFTVRLSLSRRPAQMGFRGRRRETADHYPHCRERYVLRLDASCSWIVEHGLKYRVDITVHASIPTDTFPLSSLYPSKSLIRLASETETPSTSLYSASILHDTLHKSHLLHIYRISQLLPDRTGDSFLALWRIWAARRGINRDRGGSGWFAGFLLGWVVEGGDIGGAGGVRDRTKRVRGLGKGLGYWGAIRAAWEFLGQRGYLPIHIPSSRNTAHTNFDKTSVFLSSSSGSTVCAPTITKEVLMYQQISRTEFTKAFDDIMVDPTGSVNILAGWEKGDLQLVRKIRRDCLIDRSCNTMLERRLRC